MDSLLIDPEHPRRGQPDFEAIAPHVQRDYAEAIAQLVMFPPGKEACLQNPTVAEALRHVAQEGWTDEARLSAEGALLALSGKELNMDVEGQKHVMLSCE